MKIISILLLVIGINYNCVSQDFHGEWKPVEIPSPHLESNILKECLKSNIGIYLPPSYASSSMEYPVIYFLQGYTAPVNPWACSVLDSLIHEKKVKEVIMVDISAAYITKGNFYVNSEVTGNWNNFVLQDVIPYIEANYRVKKNRSSKAIAGLSMGGYGALKIGIANTDAFDIIYSLSPGLFDKNGLSESQIFSTKDITNKVLDLKAELAPLPKEEAHKRYLEILSSYEHYNDFEFTLAYGMAFAPNTSKAPYFDFPYSVSNGDTVLNQTVWDKWHNGYGGIEELIDENKAVLNNLKLFAIDCGYNDEYNWITKGCIYYSKLLKENKIPHSFIWHGGGHVNKFTHQMRHSALPLIINALEF